ncbi:MAG: dockerin type I repeat-containing protein [Clostridia bacterium]|nr:dockerin type I repeat-containing protein [Clostridia bacterium]
MKKIVSMIILFLMTAALICGAGISVAGKTPGDVNGDGKINNKDVVLLFRRVSGDPAGAVEENCDFNGDGVVNNKDVVSLFRAVSEGTVPAEPEFDGWEQTIVNANERANGVQGKFTDASRNKYLITNETTTVLYNLTSSGNKRVESICSAEGKPYIAGTDTYITNSSGTYDAGNSSDNGRMNCNRIGYYYYDFHFRDQKFAKTAGSSNTLPLAFEHTFHTYSDKMHEELRAVATGDYSAGGRFETKTVIAADTVDKILLKNAKGESSSLSGFDFSSAEFVAFDIKGAGIYGVIMPSLDDNGYISVELSDGSYVITRGVQLPAIASGGEIRFGHRIYTSEDHDFDEIRKEAYIERNPLTDISVSLIDSAKYEGYDALAGCYKFSVRSMEFQTAYYNSPNKQFRVKARINGDGVYDRKIYVQTAENAATRRGRIECAAILDENNRMLPIPLEVGKNFDGENEEPVYWPEKGTGAAAYGEVYVPITVAKDESKRFSVLHLYQNWGNYPLKQLSFIAFHIPYYHLSVGVTETNCIAPYFVYGKDGWTLPDFRSNSAQLWDNGNGTQHTSVGRLYFLQYKDSSGKSYKSESQSANIASAGPVYADINMEYLSDDGKIKATYRHTEMAQTDENRTYYKIKLEVLEVVTINKFRDNFSFFTFDSRLFRFAKIGYLDENNTPQFAEVSGGFLGSTKYYKLGTEYPYFDYFKGTNKNPVSGDPNNGEHSTVNFGLIVRSSDITIGGEKYDGNFVFVDKYAYNLGSPSGYLNTGALTLDLTGTVTLKKGDVMELELILLPWGDYSSENDNNVRYVRGDSCADPYKITVITGEPYEDSFIPSVKAVNNTATFRLSGGKSTAAVRVYGFTDYPAPAVTFKADGKATDIKLAGVNGYDGYQVYRDADGTYSFSFNVDMDKADVYEITVKQ